MTDNPETPNPVVEIRTTHRSTGDLPVLLDSITAKLSDLVQHAASHAYRDGVNDIPPHSKNAPECVLNHMTELALALWSLAPAESFDQLIILPREMPAGLRAQVEGAVEVVEGGEEIPVETLDQMGAFVRDAMASRQAGERR